jgi:hypothetical protein
MATNCDDVSLAVVQRRLDAHRVDGRFQGRPSEARRDSHAWRGFSLRKSFGSFWKTETTSLTGRTAGAIVADATDVTPLNAYVELRNSRFFQL